MLSMNFFFFFFSNKDWESDNNDKMIRSPVCLSIDEWWGILLYIYIYVLCLMASDDDDDDNDDDRWFELNWGGITRKDE